MTLPNATFDTDSADFTRGTYNGKTCYVNLDLTRYEKENGCFYVREIYLQESNGSYTLVRIGVGLYDEPASLQSAFARLFTTAGDLKDIWEKTENLITILTDDTAKSSEKSVYSSLYEYIDSAMEYADSTEKAELQLIKNELEVSELISNGTVIIKECKKTAQKAAKAADDPAILLPDQIGDKMDECFDAMANVSKSVEDRGLRSALDKLFKKKGGKDSLLERIEKKMNNDYKQSKATFRGRYSIDPSGYVYEAVESNRISGVTATIYYRETMDAKEIRWDAEEFDQMNPLYTDEDGCYAWDVPEGFWQVRYEKDGYEAASSEWLPVPPPQLGVNVGIVSTASPTIKMANAYAEKIEVVFTQYVDVDTVNDENIRFEADGSAISGAWQAVDATQSPEDATLATTFLFIPDDELTSATVNCSASNVNNYAGRAMEDYSKTVSVTLDIKSVQVEESVQIDYQESKTISITATPAAAASGKRVNLTCGDTFILSVDQSAVFNQSGTATFKITSLLPGATTVAYEIEGTTHTGVISVSSSEIVEEPEPEPEPEPDVTLGDVNDDDEIDANDLAIIINYIVNHIEISGDALKAADVNNDDAVDANDLAVLINYVVNHVPIAKK